MDKNSNTYIFLYAAGLVVVVALALALASIGLKKPQEKNIAIEKKLNILSTVGKGMTDGNEIKDKDTYVETQYDRYIVESFIIDGNGNRKEGSAFQINMKEEYDKIKTIKQTPDKATQTALRDQLSLPVFLYKDDDGHIKYIVPVYGTGLWGALWGYLALNDDLNTVYGAIFDHKSETPGLGAEIATPLFAGQFIGKQIFDGYTLTSIKVIKGGAPEADPHGVDAISGGTITSRGVEEMLLDCLSEYSAFFVKNKK